jgi:pimeloyl-ACP methyl ester carboxylesterase
MLIRANIPGEEMKSSVAILLFGFLLMNHSTSFSAEEKYFDAAGAELRYFIEGSGSPVILLHGFSGSPEGLWIKPGTFAALVGAGYQVIALDQRGHGKSAKFYDRDSYGMEMMKDVGRLMDHLDIERAHLIGYSMGAKVANTFRASYPDRLISLTLGGYGWPWRSRDESVAEAEVRLQTDFVLPGNDLRALAAVRVSMNDLIPSEKNLRANTIPAFSLVGTTDNVVSRSDLDTLRSTMANLETKDMPGTHAGPDGAPYKPQFAAELIRFMAKHPAPGTPN